jgi:PII-like signaling protein
VSEERVKLTTYFGERDRVADRPLADELVAICERHRVSDAILFRGAEGFGRLHHVHTDRLLSLSEDLPVVATALARREHVDALLADVLSAQQRGLVSLERARLLAPATAMIDTGDRPADGDGDARKLTVYVGRGERVGGRPAFVVVCELLRASGVSGASVLLGVDGLRGGRRARARRGVCTQPARRMEVVSEWQPTTCGSRTSASVWRSTTPCCARCAPKDWSR